MTTPDQHPKKVNPIMAVIGTVMIVWAVVGSVGKCASGNYSSSDTHPHAHGHYDDDDDDRRRLEPHPPEPIHGL